VYSGGSVDINGKPIPNPTIFSKKITIIHGD